MLAEKKQNNLESGKADVLGTIHVFITKITSQMWTMPSTGTEYENNVTVW